MFFFKNYAENEAGRLVPDLSDSNEIRTHNHSLRKRTLNHLAKLAK